MLKKIYNNFVNWFYEDEIQEAKNKIQRLAIDDAIYLLNSISSNNTNSKDKQIRLNPKSDAYKMLEAELDKRIRPFQPKNTNENINKYREISEL